MNIKLYFLFIVMYIAETNCLLSSVNTLKKMNLFVIIIQDKNMTFIFAVNSEVGKIDQT